MFENSADTPSYSAICARCLDEALVAESERQIDAEYGAVLRGDAAPEEVNVARRQMRRIK